MQGGCQPYAHKFLTKGGEGISKFLKISDKGGKGGLDPPNMADIINRPRVPGVVLHICH